MKWCDGARRCLIFRVCQFGAVLNKHHGCRTIGLASGWRCCSGTRGSESGGCGSGRAACAPAPARALDSTTCTWP
eukprot:80409-Rhodomonas_salina.3